MQLDVLELVDLGAEILEAAQPLTPSISFSFLRLCGGRAMMLIFTPRL